MGRGPRPAQLVASEAGERELIAILGRLRPLAARAVVAGLALAMQRRADEAAAAPGVLSPPAAAAPITPPAE